MKKKAFFEGVVGQDVNQPPGLLSLLFLNGNGLRHRELKGKERKEMPVPNNFLLKKMLSDSPLRKYENVC